LLFSHFELVMLALVVLWNMLNICCGDTRRYIVGMEFGDVWRCNAI